MVFRSLVSGSRPLTRFGEDPLAAMQRAIERSLGDGWGVVMSALAPTEAAAMSVRVDVKEDDKAFHVTADLPGLTDKDVDVTFDDGLLTIRGEKKIERDEKSDDASKNTWHVVERSYGSFARQVSLPANIADTKIEAAFDKGVLKVTLPKAEEKSSAKKINIKAG